MIMKSKTGWLKGQHVHNHNAIELHIYCRNDYMTAKSSSRFILYFTLQVDFRHYHRRTPDGTVHVRSIRTFQRNITNRPPFCIQLQLFFLTYGVGHIDLYPQNRSSSKHLTITSTAWGGTKINRKRIIVAIYWVNGMKIPRDTHWCQVGLL